MEQSPVIKINESCRHWVRLLLKRQTE